MQKLEQSVYIQFLNANFSLKNEAQALDFYKLRLESIGNYTQLSPEDKQKLSNSIIVELFSLQKKVKGEIFDSELAEFVSINFPGIFTYSDESEVIKQLLINNVDANISDYDLRHWHIKEVAQFVQEKPELKKQYKKLFAKGNADQKNSNYAQLYLQLNETVSSVVESKRTLTSEQINEFMNSDVKYDFLEDFLVNFDKMNTQSKLNLRESLGKLKPAELTQICGDIIEDKKIITPIIFEYLAEADTSLQSKIMRIVIKNDLFSVAKQYIPRKWKLEFFVNNLFSNNSNKEQVEEAYEFCGELLQTDEQKQSALHTFISTKGYSEFLADKKFWDIVDTKKPLPTRWFIDFFNSLKYSQNNAENIPEEFAQRFPLNDSLTVKDILNTTLMYVPSLKFPERWKTQIAQLTIDTSEARRILELCASGQIDRIIMIGGEKLVANAVGFELTDWEISNTLENAVQAGWATAPEIIKKKIIETSWTYFPHSLLETKDLKAITAIASKSKLSVDSVLDYEFSEENVWLKALFTKCSSIDVEVALQSEVFRTLYQEYVTYAKDLLAVGEKALVIRCAVKGITLDEVTELISLARTQPYISFTTTATLTGLHQGNIYWEERKDKSVEGLLWDENLKKYIDTQYFALMTAKELSDFIVDRSDPTDYESVFYLIRLARENKNKILKDSEELKQEDFKRIFKYLSGRSKANITMLDELGKLAGYENPSDYSKALEEAIAGYPFASQIDNIIQLSKGEINPAKFKEISYKYLDTQSRFSADTCLVLFQNADRLGDPFNREEKRKFWFAFTGDFEKKQNYFSLAAQEVQMFLEQEVIEKGEARELFIKYVNASGAKTEQIEKLLPLCIDTQQQYQDILVEYSKELTTYSFSVLIPFHEFGQIKQFSSPEISTCFAKLLYQDKLDFNGLMTYLDYFSAYVTDQEVKEKVIFIAENKMAIYNNFLKLSGQYEFTQQEAKRLCAAGLAHYNIYFTAFEHMYELSEFTAEESQTHLLNILEKSKYQIDNQFIQMLCKKVNPEFVYETAVSYAVTYEKINLVYLNTLKNFLGELPEDQLKKYETEIRAKDDRVAFFDSSQLARKQRNIEPTYGNFREVYVGTQSLDIEKDDQNIEENRVFLVNALLFNENKQIFSNSRVEEILGSTLFQKILALKKETAQKVISENNSWMVERERAFNHFKVLGHGTWQAHSRKEGVARSQEEMLDSQAIVKVITQGPDGVGIRGEKATLGAFTNPGTKTNYGDVEDGSMLLFFLDDVLNSHVTIATDPMGADGYVGIDHVTGKYVQIPNRVLFNPQAGEIGGTNLTHMQMADFLLEFRHIVESNSEIETAVFEKISQYITEQHPQAASVLRDLHLLMRADTYPESAILWARDYYLRLLLSDQKSDKLLASTFEKVVKGLAAGALEGDLRSYMDTIRNNWDVELEELAEKPLLFMKLLQRAQDKMKIKQRQQYSTATQQLRQHGTRDKLGVAKQHTLQVRAAEKAGDVSKRDLRDNLRTTRAIFMDSENKEEYLASLDEVRRYADYMQDVKESALLRTYQKGVESLDQVNAVYYQKYADRISVCSAGSIGRGEVVISSDIDYLVLLDDRDLEQEDLDQIKRILFQVGEKMNQVMIEEFNIRPDAGLANRDRQPIVLLSKVRSFSLDTSGGRQVLEPSEMLDIEGVDGNKAVVNLFKSEFIKRTLELTQENVQSSTLLEYMDNKVHEFDKLFLGGFSQLLSRDQLLDFKMQIQRIFNFYLYKLVSEHIGSIANDGETIPSKTLDKIEYLSSKGLISPELSARFYELQLLLYRMRYRSDVLNSAQLVGMAKKTGTAVSERAKIEAKFDPQQVSNVELSRFIDLISFFSETVKEPL